MGSTKWWIVFWFLFGLLFFIFATINAVNGENDKAVGLAGIALACQARCEIKILQKRMEDKGL